MDGETRRLLRDLVLDESAFVRLTLNTGQREPQDAWRRVVVRPVALRGRRHLQFSYFDARRDVTRNVAGAAATRELEALLDLPARAVSVQSAQGTLNVQLTRSGKAILHRVAGPPAGAAAGAAAADGAAPAPAGPDLRHNRQKAHPLPEGTPDPLLQALGVMDEAGRVRPPMRGKFTQVNEFLKLLDHSGALDGAGGETLHLVDCASGSSYLSFAAYHYLNRVRRLQATLVGVDVNPRLVEKGNALAATLAYADIHFVATTIAAFVPRTAVDIVLALHACDTATDEALARGVVWGARTILAVPCCQHDLNARLERPAPFGPLLQHGILKERLADLLTDAFRARLLRLAGYDTDVVEFVSTEHSGRNLMIRAVRRHIPDPADPREAREQARLLAEYEALKAQVGVTPYLESLLPPAT